MEPKVAILIVTHNSERYISLTLKSCLQQSYRDCTIYVLDNASKDRTVEIIKSFSSPSIRLQVSTINCGPYAGLNYLLDSTHGERYVAIQDHDDVWLPSKVAAQVKFLEADLSYSACGTKVYYFFEDQSALHLRDNYSINGYVDHTSLMFRNGSFRYNSSRALPDEHFQAVTLRKSGKIGCLPEGLTVHRIRNDKQNLSSKRNRLNVRGAWEHYRYTHGRDIAGSLSIVLAGIMPVWLKGWSRKQYSYKGSIPAARRDFERQHGVQIA